MEKVNIGGVPEHFNLPWNLTLKFGAYEAENINLRWHDYYEGTGAMCKALRNGDIDMAVLLTEGIVKDIIAGNPSKIVQTYVASPLLWGIHVAADSPYKSIDNIKGAIAAISRYSSGSHLMAYINAKNNQWNLKNDLKFEVVNNLEGAIDGLTSGRVDYFLWEKFTTKPLVDQGVFRRIGVCPSPWPCFVIAVKNEFIKKNSQKLRTILNIINKKTIGFKNLENIDSIIAKRYEQNIDDVREWLSLTEWSQELISESVLQTVQNQLLALHIIPETKVYNDLVYRLP